MIEVDHSSPAVLHTATSPADVSETLQHIQIRTVRYNTVPTNTYPSPPPVYPPTFCCRQDRQDAAETFCSVSAGPERCLRVHTLLCHRIHGRPRKPTSTRRLPVSSSQLQQCLMNTVVLYISNLPPSSGKMAFGFY
jgi:hypothetical protein